jgi:hypothetical protein
LGIHAGVECRFLCDPQTGQLLGLEMFADEQLDPCELYFADYTEVNGRLLPRTITVRHGEGLYGRFQLSKITLAESKEVQP